MKQSTAKKNQSNPPRVKRKTISFRPLDDVDQMVYDAEAATGSNPTDLCNEALREFLPKFVAMKAAERQKIADDFQKKYSDQQKKK